MPALSVIVIEKAGTLRLTTMKEYSEQDLFKKCGFKSANGFEKLHSWQVNDSLVVSLYGKQTGKADALSEFAFPENMPVKTVYGNCVLVGSVPGSAGVMYPLTLEVWEEIRPLVYQSAQDAAEKREESDDEEESEEGSVAQDDDDGDDVASDDGEERGGRSDDDEPADEEDEPPEEEEEPIMFAGGGQADDDMDFVLDGDRAELEQEPYDYDE